jgi:hypothetical protein
MQRQQQQEEEKKRPGNMVMRRILEHRLLRS